MLRLRKTLALAVAGGVTYAIMEVLWRGYTHWTMMVLGGLLFLLLGGINEWFSWKTPLAIQGLIGSVIVTVAEFLAGLILNIWLGLNVWDYSHLPFNLCGQICLPFTILWVPVSIFAVVLDDWLRFWWFEEERPRYIFWKG